MGSSSACGTVPSARSLFPYPKPHRTAVRGPTQVAEAGGPSRKASRVAFASAPLDVLEPPPGNRPPRRMPWDEIRGRRTLSGSAVAATEAATETTTKATTEATTLSESEPAQGQIAEGADQPPNTLAGKVRVYRDILHGDPEYRRGIFAMTTNQLGDGLVTGGALLLLTSLAVLNPLLAGVGLAVFTLVEIIIAAVSFLRASHLRDNAEATRRQRDPTVQERSAQQEQYGKRLIRSGYIDAVASALLAVGGVGASLLGFPAAPIFLILVGVKAIQAYNKSYENGAWNCIKYTLGTQETQKRQLHMRATIGAIELGMGATIYGVGSLLTFLTLWGVGIAFPPALPFVALGTVLLGGLLTASSKIWFGRWATGSGHTLRSAPHVAN